MACLTNNFTKQLVDYHRKVDKNREEGERDCLHKHQVPLVTHILLCYIINFCLPAERSRCRDKLYSLYIIHVQAVLKSNIFPFDSNSIASFQAIDELQQEGLHQLHTTAFSWNGQMHEQPLQMKSLVPLSLLCVIVHMEYGQWQAFFIREKSACLMEVSVIEQILQKFPKFLETLGELSMHKQCLPGFFSPLHESLGMRLLLQLYKVSSNRKLVMFSSTAHSSLPEHVL